MVTVSWLLIIAIFAAAFAIFDGIRRLQGRHSNTILAGAEIAAAALFILCIFFPQIPLGARVFSIILEIVLILVLVLPGRAGRAFVALSIVALILNSIWLLTNLGWLAIPGIA